MIQTTFYRFRCFAHEHDDIPAFHAAYLVSTVLAAAILNLGYFAVLILLHMCLDFFKYREVHGFSLVTTFRAMILESITDLALLLVALTFSVYLSHTFLLAGVSGILRSELTILEAVATLLPKIHVLEHLAAVFLGIHSYLHAVVDGVESPMSRIQKWSMIAVLMSTAFLVASFFLYQGDMNHLLEIYARELIPAL